YARQHQRPDQDGELALRATPLLDHRVRLPDRSSGSGVWRVPWPPGPIPDRGVQDRAPQPTHRPDALVPAPGRAASERLAVRAAHGPGEEEAGVRSLPAASAPAPGRRSNGGLRRWPIAPCKVLQCGQARGSRTAIAFWRAAKSSAARATGPWQSWSSRCPPGTRRWLSTSEIAGRLFVSETTVRNACLCDL